MTSRTSIEAAALTVARAGGRPSENEDSVQYAVGRGSREDWSDFVAVVADGVGTSREPAAASRTAVETWIRFIESRFTERPEVFSGFDETQFGHLLRECFAQAHRQVQRNAPGGSATAAGVCIQGPWLLAATVGDARVYRYSLGTLEQLTEDQIDATGNPTDVLGGRSAAPAAAAYAKRSLSPGDWIILCSDGLDKTLPPEELATLIRTLEHPQAVARLLKERVQAQKVADDVTAVLARVDEVGEPFWSGVADFVAASAEVKSSSPPPTSQKKTETAVQESHRANDPRSPVMSPAWTEMEKRLERLERTPGGNGLSPQDNERLEREFTRLEGHLRSLEEQVAQSTRFPLWWTLIALLVGLSLGALLPLAWSRAAGSSLTDETGDKEGASSGMTLKVPADFRTPLEYRLTDTGLVLRYLSSQGGQKVAVFPYAASGKSSVTYAIPMGEDTQKYGKTESEGKAGKNASSRKTSRDP